MPNNEIHFNKNNLISQHSDYMISDQTSPKDAYHARITNEVRNIHAKPLGYDASKLLTILDDFELDPRVNIMCSYLK